MTVQLDESASYGSYTKNREVPNYLLKLSNRSLTTQKYNTARQDQAAH